VAPYTKQTPIRWPRHWYEAIKAHADETITRVPAKRDPDDRFAHFVRLAVIEKCMRDGVSLELYDPDG
jgi:hypothetical protein